MRSALGAGRGRLVRQLLTESVLLAVLGGGAGLLLASASLDSLLSLQPEGLPRLGEVRIDPAVAGFAALLSISTGLLFGVFPALHVDAVQLGPGPARCRPRAPVGPRPASAGRPGHRPDGAGPRPARRSGPPRAQLPRLQRVDPGFRTENALTFRISLPESAYPTEARRSAFFEDLLTRLSALPGVRDQGAVAGLPLSGTRFSISFTVEGRPPLPPAQQPSMEVRVASAATSRPWAFPSGAGRGFEPGIARDRPRWS